jgi:hypothetical protein
LDELREFAPRVRDPVVTIVTIVSITLLATTDLNEDATRAIRKFKRLVDKRSTGTSVRLKIDRNT